MVRLAREDLAGVLADDGLLNMSASERVYVPATLIIDQTMFVRSVLLKYKSFAGKKGAAKLLAP